MRLTTTTLQLDGLGRVRWWGRSMDGAGRADLALRENDLLRGDTSKSIPIEKQKGFSRSQEKKGGKQQSLMWLCQFFLPNSRVVWPCVPTGWLGLQPWNLSLVPSLGWHPSVFWIGPVFCCIGKDLKCCCSSVVSKRRIVERKEGRYSCCELH